MVTWKSYPAVLGRFLTRSADFSLPVLMSVLEDGKEGRDGMLTATGRGI